MPIFSRLFRRKKRVSEKSKVFIITVIWFYQFIFPGHTTVPVAQAAEITPETTVAAPTVVQDNALPILDKKVEKPSRVITIPVTAYSSSVDETDDTPCITANNYDVCSNDTENVIAANFLPFGTKVKFRELNDDVTYVVQDRMNIRYKYRIDIWKKSKQTARAFGLKKLTAEIYED